MTTVISAMPTVFTPDGRLDRSGCERLYAAWGETGLDAAFAGGSTGEFAALDRAERAELAQLTVDTLGPERSIVHVGASSADEVARLIDDARTAGVTRAAVMTPHMIGVSDATLVRFFERVAADAEGLSLYVYVYAAITGVAVSPAVMSELSRLPGVVGAKVSGEPIAIVGAHRDAVAPGFTLLTGGDGDLARVGDHGVDGVVSGVSAAFPATFAALRAALDGASDERGPDDASRGDAVAAVVDTVAGSLARIKRALELRGLPGGRCRLPVEALDAATERSLADAVRRYA